MRTATTRVLFNNKPVWKRILVVVMGAVMNIILGLAFDDDSTCTAAGF